MWWYCSRRLCVSRLRCPTPELLQCGRCWGRRCCWSRAPAAQTTRRCPPTRCWAHGQCVRLAGCRTRGTSGIGRCWCWSPHGSARRACSHERCSWCWRSCQRRWPFDSLSGRFTTHAFSWSHPSDRCCWGPHSRWWALPLVWAYGWPRAVARSPRTLPRRRHRRTTLCAHPPEAEQRGSRPRRHRRQALLHLLPQRRATRSLLLRSRHAAIFPRSTATDATRRYPPPHGKRAPSATRHRTPPWFCWATPTRLSGSRRSTPRGRRTSGRCWCAARVGALRPT
ncbi:unannotated protein [freshwater metagenome]|uniref:Unannotated protein n=1 Tax=freshwater metagenome TaxID=449393 RepID=A0A6J7J2Q8_9ZZZZ